MDYKCSTDFYDRYFIRLEPYKLIFLTTGNISSDELIGLFDRNIGKIIGEIEMNNVVEVSRTNIITID
jgi:predicted nuclease of predicted toxin-antitoxin system